jgi:hypothetical protein
VIPRQQPTDLLGDDERWALLQHCLNNMPIDVRAAGALILLFGLQAQRIRHLCAEHVVIQGNNAYLITGEHPILLPPRLGAIMTELADRPPRTDAGGFCQVSGRLVRREAAPRM